MLNCRSGGESSGHVRMYTKFGLGIAIHRELGTHHPDRCLSLSFHVSVVDELVVVNARNVTFVSRGRRRGYADNCGQHNISTTTADLHGTGSRLLSCRFVIMISGLEDPQRCNETNKRRPQRACDLCRRRKVRCERGSSGSTCSQCAAQKSPCTYAEATKGKDSLSRHVEYLENKVEKLEQLLRKLSPDNDFLKVQGSSQTSLGSAVESLSNYALSAPSQSVCTSTHPLNNPYFREEEDENSAHHLLALHEDPLSTNPSEYHYYGKSTFIMLVRTAMESKQQCAENAKASPNEGAIEGRRLQHWNSRPWQSLSAVCDPPNFVFPPVDLLLRLVYLYFERVNLFFPLLHWPSFVRSIMQGLHNSDDWFGAVLLLVCAVGSHYCDDPRVLLEGDTTYHSSGWKWFQQVKCTIMHRDNPGPCSLYNLQLYCLAATYLQAKTAHDPCWVMVGTAIRLAQDGGIHLKWKADTESWTLEDELKTRAFWVLVVMDITTSYGLGRPCTMQAQDFDLDYPLDVDDEYLECAVPKQLFKQPKGEPSLVAAFNVLLELYQLRAFILQEIYCVKNTKKALASAGGDCKQRIIAELNSMLDDWVKSVPEHLRWDPKRKNTDHFKQSVVLFTNFYDTKILIYRPFIPSPRKPSRYSFPALGICTNAARSCSNVLHAMRTRQLDVLPFVQLQAFLAGIVLLLNFWDGKRSDMFTHPQKDVLDARKCMVVLRMIEKRWDSAGRLCDVLNELLPVGNPSPTDPSPSSHTKGQQPTYQGLKLGSSADSIGVSRANAGSRQVSRGTDDIGRRMLSHSYTQSKYQDNSQHCSSINITENNLPYTAVVPYLDPMPSQGNRSFFSHVDTDAADYATQFNYQQAFPEYAHATQIPTLTRTDTIPVGTSSTAITVPSLHIRMPTSQNQVQDWPTSSASELNTFGAFSPRPSASSSISGWAGVDYERSPQRSLRQPQPQARTPLPMLQMQHQLAPQTYDDSIYYGFTRQEG
ncbi:hypothetical protein APHAL10511_005288 [Amanita phalloides]|nr:hypothetical protein APHAL10511_005288 [Amanita phalloides]